MVNFSETNKYCSDLHVVLLKALMTNYDTFTFFIVNTHYRAIASGIQVAWSLSQG